MLVIDIYIYAFIIDICIYVYYWHLHIYVYYWFQQFAMCSHCGMSWIALEQGRCSHLYIHMLIIDIYILFLLLIPTSVQNQNLLTAAPFMITSIRDDNVFYGATRCSHMKSTCSLLVKSILTGVGGVKQFRWRNQLRITSWPSVRSTLTGEFSWKDIYACNKIGLHANV